MKLVQRMFFAIALTAVTQSAHSQDFLQLGSEKFAAGVFVGNQISGISVKYRATDKITAEAQGDFVGDITSFGVRGLYAFFARPSYELYGFGSLTRFAFDAGPVSVSTTGFGAGGGIDYDLRGLNPNLPPLFASAELGVALGSFSDFSGFSTGGLPWLCTTTSNDIVVSQIPQSTRTKCTGQELPGTFGSWLIFGECCVTAHQNTIGFLFKPYPRYSKTSD